ncbi:hypothetical protein [Geoalkalibacter halelectricus]|uniref:hypothetical protein n=1 Tax=Geoalkalibacter halelectricus TaxID=2847045 RepID=UPI003D1ADBC5
MNIEELLNNQRKLVRTIERKLPCVLNVKNYVTPQTIEEMREVGPLSPHLEIERRWFYFKKNSKEAFYEIVDKLSSLKILEENNSFSNIFNEILKHIEKWLPEGKCDHLVFIHSCLESLIEKQRDHVYYTALEGISLENIKEFNLGSMQVGRFENYIEEIEENKKSHEQEPHIASSTNEFIEKNFKGKIVIRGEVRGDQEKSKEKFVDNCQLVVNMLRLIASTFYEQGYSRKYVSINLPSGKSSGSIQYLSSDISRSGLILGWSSTEPEEMPINIEMVEELREYYFFNELISFAWEQDQTEIESSIITAIHWFGEAQNERSLDNSFMLHWTAIETVFSIGKDYIAENIAVGLSTLLAFGGYKIISPEDKETTYYQIKNLYSKRSKVIHRGHRKKVTTEDIIEISKYSKWVILTLLGLRNKGFRTLSELKNETDRIHGLTKQI